MPNPLTQSRKLGFPLVGKDGFLTGLARMSAGVTPLDQIKNVLAARKQFDEDTAREISGHQAQANLKKTNFELERAPVDAAYEDEVRKQQQTERASRGAALGAAMVPGPPNPDGSPIIDPDAAIGMAGAKKTMLDLQNSDPTEEYGDALHSALTQAGIRTGIAPGTRVDRSQLQQLMTALNQANTNQSRLDARRMSADAAADARADRISRGDEDRRTRLTTTLSTSLQGNETFKRYSQISGEADALKSTIRNAVRDPSGASDITIMNMFQRIVDPGVAVREGDVALMQSAQGLIPRVGNISDWLAKGNRLSPTVRAQMFKLIDPILDVWRRKTKSTLEPIKRRAVVNRLNLDEIFPDEFLDVENEDDFSTVSSSASTTAAAPLPNSSARRRSFEDR